MLPFGIGFSEVLLIMVVVLLVVGPHKLPEMARTLGKGMRALRRAGDELRDAVQVEEIRRTMYDEPVQAWRDASRPDDVEPEDKSAKPHPYADIDAAEAQAQAQGAADEAEIEDAEVESIAPPAAEPADEAPPKLTPPPDTVARGSVPAPTEDDEPADT